MLNDDSHFDRIELIRIANLAREIGNSALQVSTLRKGLTTPGGLIYAGTFNMLVRLSKLGIVEFTSEQFRGKHITRLTTKGRAVLIQIEKNEIANAKAVQAVHSTRGKRSQRTSVHNTAGVQHKKADTQPT